MPHNLHAHSNEKERNPEMKREKELNFLKWVYQNELVCATGLLGS